MANIGQPVRKIRVEPERQPAPRELPPKRKPAPEPEKEKRPVKTG